MIGMLYDKQNTSNLHAGDPRVLDVEEIFAESGPIFIETRYDIDSYRPALC